jgi:hypothetical protein
MRKLMAITKGLSDESCVCDEIGTFVAMLPDALNGE